MSSRGRWFAAALLAASAPRIGGAQSTAEYRARLDSAERAWRPLAEAEAIRLTDANARLRRLPTDSVRVGPVIVRADSAFVALGRTVAERLAPRAMQAYGRFSDHLAEHQFVIAARGITGETGSVTTGVADSTGEIRQRGGALASSAALERSWTQKIEQIVAEHLDPSVRTWLGTVIPMERTSQNLWSQARADLLLAPAAASRRCAGGDIATCLAVLNISPVEDPAFAFFTGPQRRDLVLANTSALRRADPRVFDRCADRREQSACDSLARLVPSDAVPRPVPPSVRQSLVSFALERGGSGAFDRFASAENPDIKLRLESASGIPAAELVTAWRARLLESTRASTSLGGGTALSSIFWIGVCACLALRSSRWR